MPYNERRSQYDLDSASLLRLPSPRLRTMHDCPNFRLTTCNPQCMRVLAVPHDAVFRRKRLQA